MIKITDSHFTQNKDALPTPRPYAFHTDKTRESSPTKADFAKQIKQNPKSAAVLVSAQDGKKKASESVYQQCVHLTCNNELICDQGLKNGLEWNDDVINVDNLLEQLVKQPDRLLFCISNKEIPPDFFAQMLTLLETSKDDSFNQAHNSNKNYGKYFAQQLQEILQELDNEHLS
jgi:hypothetical protein